MKKSNKIFKVIVIFFLVFLYAPALLLPIFSFNNSKVISFPLSGFSTIWFEELLYENTLHNALFNSLLIAISSTILATILGTLVARASTRYIFYGKKISITGSSRVGKLILKQAADKVQRVTMELSGHSPFIVFDDADIKKAADMAIAAKFRNNGQVCISPNRFYIQEKRKEEFIKAFVDKTKKLKIGNGLDKDVQLGPLTTAKRLSEVETLVEITKKEGAKVLIGGKRPSGFNKGYYWYTRDNIGI